jgi:hypothetical protein
MKVLVLVRGLPGSGKSHLVSKIIAECCSELNISPKDGVNVYSTDEYWTRPDGKYDFNFRLIGEAHKWNQDRFFGMITFEAVHFPLCPALAIIDNTNTTWKEMLPYIKKAVDNDWEVRFVEPCTAWRDNAEECCKRCSHGVPLETIQKMKERFEDHDTVLKKLIEFQRARK